MLHCYDHLAFGRRKLSRAAPAFTGGGVKQARADRTDRGGFARSPPLADHGTTSADSPPTERWVPSTSPRRWAWRRQGIFVRMIGPPDGPEPW